MNPLAAKYLEYYKKAYRDKRGQGICEMLDKCDLYWEGDVNHAKNDADPASNVNIIHPNVEGQVAMLIEQNIAITALPQTPADTELAETARLVLEFIKDKNKLTRKLDVHERRREKYGTGILRVIYDPDALGGAGLPIIEPCDNRRIFIDPCITDIYKTNEAEYIIETIPKSVHWARENFGEDKALKIKKNFYPEEGQLGTSDSYLHMLVWTLAGGKLRLVQMSGCGVILSDSGEGFYPENRYPYFFTPLYYREGSLWGKGDVELLMPLQDLINDLDDQIRLSARLTGNPQRLVSTGSGIDLDALTNEAGLNIPVNDINAVKNLTPPELPAYIEERRNFAMQYETQRVSRFSDQMTGNKQQGVITATEAMALQQGGSMGIGHKKLILQETLSEVFEYCLALVKEYWSREVAIRVTDKLDEFMFFRTSQFKNRPVLSEADPHYRRRFKKLHPEAREPQYMERPGEVRDAEFDIKVTVGAGLPTNRAFVYSMMMELTKEGMITHEEMRRWLVNTMGIPVSSEAEENSQSELRQQNAMSSTGRKEEEV